MRRGLTLVSGLGALAALIVMLVLVAIGPDDGDESAGSRSTPFAPRALTVGVQDDQLATISQELIPGRIERLATSGVTVTRVDVHWIEIAANAPAAPTNPADPAYSWTRYDAIFDGLAARRIEAIAVFSRSPAWANGGKEPQWAPDRTSYASFVRAFASRYNGRGHARVRLYEPWDEPNNPAYLLPQWDETTTPPTPASPATYAGLLASARREIRAVDPEATIIGLSAGHVETSAPPVGGVAVLDFVQALVPLSPEMDAVAQHLEPVVAPNASTEAVPSFATLPRLVQEFDRLAPGAPILITRMGYATAPTGLSEEDQAAYLTQALERLAAVGRVRLVVWHALQDSPERASGLLRADGTERPSWTTFASGPKSLPSGAP